MSAIEKDTPPAPKVPSSGWSVSHVSFIGASYKATKESKEGVKVLKGYIGVTISKGDEIKKSTYPEGKTKQFVKKDLEKFGHNTDFLKKVNFPK